MVCVKARKLGPWSSAVELIEARTAAAKAREGKLSEAAKADIGSLADDAIAWAPKRSLSLGARPPVTVGPLFQACLTLLVDHIEDVETLCGLPDIIKVQSQSSESALARHSRSGFSEFASADQTGFSCLQGSQA